MISKKTIAVLIACHNRKVNTITCLQSLYAAKLDHWDMRIYLVDDASTDGSYQAIADFDPSIQIIIGNGNWFWAHSMYQAELAIVEPYDAVMWLNDDIELNIDSLWRLDDFNSKNSESILIGQFRSSVEEKITYGGFLKYDQHPFHFNLIYSANILMHVDTFNGNLVFIPKSISEKVGPIDGGFAHAYADIDYGLRAKQLGVEMLIIPGFIGICDANPKANFNNLADELAFLLNTKSSPIKSQIRFLRRHSNFTWPIYFFAPFVNLLLRSLFRFFRISKQKK